MATVSVSLTLEECLRDTALLAQQMFIEEGEVHPHYFVELSGGKVVTLPGDFSTSYEKSRTIYAVRRFLEETHARRYVFFCEGWRACLADAEEASHLAQAEEHGVRSLPQAQEVISYHAEDKDHMISGYQVITREADGRVSLSKLEIDETSLVTEGRMASLMPRPEKGKLH